MLAVHQGVLQGHPVVVRGAAPAAPSSEFTAEALMNDLDSDDDEEEEEGKEKTVVDAAASVPTSWTPLAEFMASQTAS